MEQSRLIIAIAISFGIFFLWSIFFTPKTPEKQSEVIQKEDTRKSAAEAPPTIDINPVAPAASPVMPADTHRNAKTITVDNDLYQMTLSEQGAAVTGMTLKKYKETIDDNSPLKELIANELRSGSVLTSISGNGSTTDLSRAVFTVNHPQTEYRITDEPLTITFSYNLPSGLSIEKSYRFLPHTYLIGLNIKVENHQTKPFAGTVAVGLDDFFPKSNQRSLGFIGPSGLINNKLRQIAIKKISDNGDTEGKIKWVAVERLYFMSSLVLDEPVPGQMKITDSNDIVTNELVMKIDDIASGGAKSFHFNLFMGPKNWELLKSYHNELDQAINFGWFDILAKPCLWFMNFIYRFIPNYGVAIIILTIITRLMFWPLAQKSYKSMGAMRKLAPLMKEIREKYKDDKARINQETMALYRTYKINPVSGCLPMVIQLPVFFALYRMLYMAIELRHAPFFGWIQDLSAPDRLFHFNFKVPFMQEPTGIPVLTIIMGVTMLLQQKMTPTPGDPAQAKMMMIMPVVFMVIFINFSSGLVLYWLVGNLIAIFQQYFTQKKLA